MADPLPRLLEPAQLASILDDPTVAKDLLIVDLCKDSQYPQAHVPGAVHVSPAELVCGHPPAPGKLPDLHRLEALFSRLGLQPDTRVIAYDDEGGGWAGRFIWTLDVIGHRNWSYLNGGMIAWQNENFPLEAGINEADSRPVELTLNTIPIAEIDDILPNLKTEGFAIWDARSREEYDGSRTTAMKNGHIPGAIHCEWTSLMDPQRNLRLREDAAVILSQLGLTPDKQIVTHCQSHHRSGWTYLVARLLGYPHIKGYHGSWSEWGNRHDTPVETTGDLSR